MTKVGIVQALADCLETLRQGWDLDVALQSYPEHCHQLKALLEVASLIRPLAEDVAPSPELRESIWALLLELPERPNSPPLGPGMEPSEAC
jgi:hypothetical protein